MSTSTTGSILNGTILIVLAATGAGRAEENQQVEPAPVTNSIGMQLVPIPAGEFLMGSPDDEDKGLYFGNEKRPHKVQISRPFYLGAFEVTQAEYEKLTGKNPSWHSNAQLFQIQAFQIPRDTSKYPVDSVSGFDAKKFCDKLTELPDEKEAGRVYRLPTEAEWEYACRAGTTTPFHFGATCNGNEANVDGRVPYPLGKTERGRDLCRTTRVGNYKPNAWGLFDMHGNAEEWCSGHVLRGGGCYSWAADARSAARNDAARGGGLDAGFRVVMITSPLDNE